MGAVLGQKPATTHAKNMICEADGIILSGHARCRFCSILAGAKHHEPALFAGQCASCYAYRADHPDAISAEITL